MSFLLKNNIHSSIAKTFYDDVLSQRNMYYYFLGRTQQWNNTNDYPPEIEDTLEEENGIRNNIIYLHKIGVSDICLVTKRIDWEANTVYDRYDGNISIKNKSATGATHIKDAKFYVLTDEMNVYKCINNNGGALSTIKPTGTSYDNIEMIDGYIWKFLYTVSPVLQYKFLTTSHMPVVKALNRRYYEGFGIDSVTIKNSGYGYDGSITTEATIMGDGNGAEIKLSINPSNGSISNVIITNPGENYTAGAIKIVSRDGKGTGKYGNPSAVLIPNFYNGKLDSVSIVDPGLNYSTDLNTNIIVNGNGSGAVLYPVVDNGRIVDVIIDTPGSGYTNSALYISSINGRNAELVVSSTIGDISSLQSNIELLAVPGAVYVVDIKTNGLNYTYATCVVDGDGNGLSITPVIYDGKVVQLKINNPGINYTWCNITIVGDGSGATVQPILSPIKGHGFNVVDELFADTISIYSTLNFNSNQKLLINNDYRQFGIIKNPERLDSASIFRDTASTSCYYVTLNNAISTYPDQELVLIGDTSKKFVVVGTDKSNTVLLLSLGGISPSSGMVLLDQSTNSTVTVEQSSNPIVDKFSGEMIFVDNRQSIFQSDEQIISLRTNIKF